MSFGAAVRNFWSNYVGFSGRATRAEYWWVVLFFVIVVVPLAIFDAIVFEELLFEFGFGLLTVLFTLAVFLPYLALVVRRFHDVGMSGWLVILTFIPYVGGLFAFVVSLIDSQKGTNRFGPSLKYPSPESDLSGQSGQAPTRPSQSGQASFGPVRDTD